MSIPEQHHERETWQRQLLEAHEAKAELQSFLDDAHDLIQSTDAQGRYVYVNKAWCDTLGYTQEEARELTIFDVIDPAYHAHCREKTEALSRIQQSFSVNVLFRSKSGAAIRIEGNISVLRKKNGEWLTRGIFQDITQRQHAEDELKGTKEMLEQTSRVARVGGWEVDLISNTVHWTQVTREIHEVDEHFVPDLATGIHFYKEGESRETIQQAVGQAIENGAPFSVELQLVTARGNECWVRSIGHTEFNDGQCVRVYGTFQDVTEQKYQEEMIIQAMKEAKAASVAKSEFLANMSHEIRTPLNGVIGFSDLLMRTPLNENQTQYMQAVHHSANALLDLINDILDFSKIEAGKLELSEEKCDLWKLLEQVSDIVKHKTEEKNIELLLNMSAQLPRYAWLDPIRIRQILINLVSNAVKFTEAGEIEIMVRPISEDKAASVHRVEFSIRDTGIGIAPSRQRAIFKAFSQEDASTTRKYGGTGLGLSISNQLLGLMGSHMKLESKPGKGSRFFFQLEVQTEDQGGEVPTRERDIQRVLVVDDHAKNRQIVHEMLLLQDIASDIASDGQEALEKLKSRDYDLLVVDYHMPDMNGIQVIRQVRQTLELDRERLPVILLHSSGDDTSINEARQSLGIHKVISKPISLYQLLDTLDSLDSPCPATAFPPDTPTILSEQSIRILLVDDTLMNRLVARTMIAKVLPHAIIEEAIDGVEAVKKFQAFRPDLIFMDIQMPGMSGYEASQKIRAVDIDPSVTIIALTAGTMKGERDRCLQAGMDDYLSKPFGLDMLLATLRPWVGQPDASLAADVALSRK